MSHGARQDDGAQRALAALSHPTRRQILDYLQLHDRASPVEMSAAFGMTLGSVAYHVRCLQSLGYLRVVKRTRRRGAIEHHYEAVDDDPERVVAQLAGRFFTTPEPKLGTRALLDATAIAELHADLDRLFRRTRELESQTVARAALGGSRTFPVHVVCVVDAGSAHSS
jgi:DNA-binding transcriptional ArsR family regulator